MRIDINQRKVSFHDVFEIYVNGALTHNATSELFRLSPLIHLRKKDVEQPVLTLKKKWRWFKAEYDILFYNGLVVTFNTISRWKSHFRCEFAGDVYDIYGHRGRRNSVYKNDVQTGWWNKQAVSWFDGDNYAIVANDDCVPELLIAFCLIIDNYRSAGKGKSTITIDLGTLGAQVKKFDAGWQPAVSDVNKIYASSTAVSPWADVTQSKLQR